MIMIIIGVADYDKIRLNGQELVGNYKCTRFMVRFRIRGDRHERPGIRRNQAANARIAHGD